MNSMFCRLMFAVAVGSILHADSEVTLQQAILLNRVRAHVTEALNTLPNYTCLQTIERTHRRARAKRFHLVDTVRLEVALVDGKELFSWPGERKFDDREISKIVTGGAIGNGAFALHAKAVFQGNSARFDYIGERIREGRRTLRWDYDVPRFRSGYLIRVGEKQGVVGFRGSFWIHPDSLDLIRLEVQATDIPPHLEVLEAKDAIDYQRVKIGPAEFLLPKGSELRMSDFSGAESVNRTTFTGCRQYTGESTLIFTDPAEDAKEEAKPPGVLDVPPGIGFEAELETPISLVTGAVGDPVTLKVRKDAKHRGAVVLPSGTLIHGRISLLRKRDGESGYILAMTFHDAGHRNARGPVRLKIEHVAMNGVTLAEEALSAPARRDAVQVEAAPAGALYTKGGAINMRRGLRMYWRTQPLLEEDKQ